MISTVECDMRVKRFQIGNKVVKLSLCDTAGQERIRHSMLPAYLHNVHGIVLCYDVTNWDSLACLHSWYEDFIQRYAPDNVEVIMVGTKYDLWDSPERAVGEKSVSNVAKGLNVPNVFCSAKDDYCIEAVFRTITSPILQHRLEAEAEATSLERMSVIVIIGNDKAEKKRKKKKGKCC